ncbi:MAG: DUF3131 domain-containing protein, partial [Rhodobacteraceae bacterium]|nr:DUF3131 domain-containing protein [Paracoccaceae bacterium]
SAADYAQVALEQEIAGHISNQNLADLILRDNFGFQRFIGLHLFEPAASNPDLGEGFELFRAELLKLGFAHSHGPVPETSPLLSQMGYWVPSGLSQTDLQPEEVTQSMPVSLSGGVSDGDGFRVLVSDPAGGRQGLDANAHLRLPVLPLQSFFAGSNLAGLNGSSTSEFVLTISPDTLLTRPQRAMARRVLIDFSRAGVSEFVPVPVFARNRIPGGGVISRFRQVESARKTTRPVRKPIGAGDRQALLEDAKLAWQYFEQMTNPNTGLCPSTVAKSGSSSTRLEFITMWEMASHINGLIGAADIGILSRDGFRARMAKIMANIRGRSSNDRLLPQEWIHSDRNGSGNRNFDACDSSRLLAALLNLVDHPFSNVDVSALVESWDLDKVVVDKRIHSVIDQKLEPVFESHCGHYAARSFRLWGLEAQSPYEVTEGKSAADGQMELLHTAHNIGIIGTEPLLLEAMDFGMSTESSFLADTLFSAQLREYEKSGTLTCVSECSIEREPWFTYQGLDIGAQTDEWIVVATSDKAEFHNQKFAHDHLSLSAKGAYLWAAHHPHEYSDKLVSFVRENGKTDFGFVSSYYTNRGVATKGYSDLNTNGIILQAISRMLAGG